MASAAVPAGVARAAMVSEGRAMPCQAKRAGPEGKIR